ncbi:hypothetical protein PACID_16870 [Acidipropionibacterium acidipropionici ATCC 4875]|uniref:Uncharacterized protein n=1 Tax=Acidipropionibacterium acidipropionici (strain ATCC 4875 / DSM 20272 / JCM 6432 / NBRC 12425 / NCIMB 8070 / 4) TaxID=1171373 RepID=K7SJN3_ACIA4|nr:hypothetical protein PACID_16870 [Acidipropionibacterium acidipropionici ATCC 4875]
MGPHPHRHSPGVAEDVRLLLRAVGARRVLLCGCPGHCCTPLCDGIGYRRHSSRTRRRPCGFGDHCRRRTRGARPEGRAPRAGERAGQ